jgi:hypothetical protein
VYIHTIAFVNFLLSVFYFSINRSKGPLVFSRDFYLSVNRSITFSIILFKFLTIGVVNNLFREDFFFHAKRLGNININTFMLPYECFTLFFKEKNANN